VKNVSVVDNSSGYMYVYTFDDRHRGHDSQARSPAACSTYYRDATINISYVNVKVYHHNIVGVGVGDIHSMKGSGERSKLIRQSTFLESTATAE
jgi:hypothetical protein